MRRGVVAMLIGCFCVSSVVALPSEGAEKTRQKRMGEVDDESALVYFIRTKKFQGSARTIFVYSDGEFVGTLDNNCYTFAYLEPGEHLLWLNLAKVTEEVELEAGEVYFFNVWPKGTTPDFENVGPEWGGALIEDVKSFCSPSSKEIEKAESHITNRRGKAETAAAKEPEGRYWRSHEKSVGLWPHADLSSYHTLYLEEFALTDPKASERKKSDQVMSVPGRITDLLEREIDDGLFAEIHRGSPPEPVEGAVTLQGEITRYKPGSRTSRSLLIGTGNAYFDFIVRLVDSASGEQLAEFSDQRSWVLGGSAGQSVGIEEMEESFAYEVSVYLDECRQGKGEASIAEPAANAHSKNAGNNN